MNLLLQALGWVRWLLDATWELLLAELREHPERALIALWLFARALGKTIQTGQLGVRFRFGRVHGALEPGFHWLAPGLERIRVVPARSQTLDLKQQRLSTPKGLVLELDANLVFRIEDPVLALTEVDDYRAGCLTALALAVQEVVWRYGDHGARELKLMGSELADALQPRLARWGIVVEETGFTTLSPSPRTLRLTQLGARLAERRELLAHFDQAGLTQDRALGLLGSPVQLRERASTRYRRAARLHPRGRNGSPRTQQAPTAKAQASAQET
ncbi:MAG: SPFH domain-containing protein [Planctomycetes bacterium]|nr:SPFH domain-containing protein [Planctomycetota bacterium]